MTHIAPTLKSGHLNSGHFVIIIIVVGLLRKRGFLVGLLRNGIRMLPEVETSRVLNLDRRIRVWRILELDDAFARYVDLKLFVEDCESFVKESMLEPKLVWCE